MIPGQGTALGAHRPANDQLAVRRIIPPPFKVTRKNGEGKQERTGGGQSRPPRPPCTRLASPVPHNPDLGLTISEAGSLDQISMISRTRDHRIRGGTGPAPSIPVAVIPQASQNATSTCGDAGSFILSTSAEFFRRRRQSVGGTPEVFLGADLPAARGSGRAGAAAGKPARGRP
jgi:hypothetical protein